MRAIDLFAGAGGFSTGATRAGVRVVWAANHWQAAVDIHSANHPEVDHACQDLQQANFHRVPKHDLCLASPSCVGHSRARGRDRGPVHDAARSTAWAVVTELEVNRPQFCVVENVEEFQDWALYPAWRSACNALGYSVAPHLIVASDLGVPQDRKRLYLVLSRSLAPLQLTFEKQQAPAASSLIDWDGGRWSKIDRPGRAARTLGWWHEARNRGMDRGLFVYHGNSAPRSIDRPFPTIAAADAIGVFRGDEMRMLSPVEARRAMGFPESYILPHRREDAMVMLGNAVCPPVAQAICEKLIRGA